MTFYPFPAELEPSRLGDRTGRNDRLVRRFSAGLRLRVHIRLGAHPNLNNRPIAADVVNVSVAGVSLRVTGSLRVHPGATITVGDGLSTAACRVAYARPEGQGSQLLGLEYTTQTDQFRLDVGQIIAALRRDRGQIIKAWHHPN